ncbi:hypothetical protein B0H34DRAFT_750859 [Crassisporium funariophilum]|nr:hypothetical protein B0H34DRAFT_750859 [Crassisporium funariophilum]
MFRTCISNGSLAIASTSRSGSLMHTSAVLYSRASKQTGLRNKKINLANSEERAKLASANRPSVVLGTRPNDEEDKWKNCDLAKILVDQEELASSTELLPTKHAIGTIELPKQFGFGVNEVEKRMLFEDLPLVSAEMAVGNRPNVAGILAQSSESVREAESRELAKAKLFAKTLDLRNANAAGIAYENRRRIILAFSSPENPFDTGRAEVQAALLTYKIRNLWNHLKTFRRDIGNRRSLRTLVHERAKVLKYLKGKSRDRYETVLERLALEPESVEGELVV